MRPTLIENPPNPWASRHVDYLGEPPSVPLKVMEDSSREILSTNNSPDLPFTYSVNPYRGCYHGCSYCYARPTHEYLSLGAGSDFESVILIKPRAAELLRRAFSRPSWKDKGDLVVFSGVTDCYQPLEASYELTRKCLEVCLEFQNAAAIITKSVLIERDLDVLSKMAARDLVSVAVSIPFWTGKTYRAMEMHVSSPERRMKCISRLAEAGVSVGVNVAPIIPGLTDSEIPHILEAAAKAGAKWAGHTLLRLPGSVKDVFETRLRREMPLAAERILSRIRQTRGGSLYKSKFGERQRGQGVYAEMIDRLFAESARRVGLAVNGERFRRGAPLNRAAGEAEGSERPAGSMDRHTSRLATNSRLEKRPPVAAAEGSDQLCLDLGDSES